MSTCTENAKIIRFTAKLVHVLALLTKTPSSALVVLVKLELFVAMEARVQCVPILILHSS